jgi:thiosulfate reductase cytochrome b subunit
MGDLAKTLIIIGILLVIAGLMMLVMHKAPSLIKLPGDVVIKKEHFTLYLPLTTSIIISIILSLLLYLIRKFR